MNKTQTIKTLIKPMNKTQAIKTALSLFLDENKYSEKRNSLFGRVSKRKIFELYGKEGLFRIENMTERKLTFFPFLTYTISNPEVSNVCFYILSQNEYEKLESAYLKNI